MVQIVCLGWGRRGIHSNGCHSRIKEILMDMTAFAGIWWGLDFII